MSAEHSYDPVTLTTANNSLLTILAVPYIVTWICLAKLTSFHNADPWRQSLCISISSKLTMGTYFLVAIPRLLSKILAIWKHTHKELKYSWPSWVTNSLAEIWLKNHVTSGTDIWQPQPGHKVPYYPGVSSTEFPPWVPYTVEKLLTKIESVIIVVKQSNSC